MNIGPELVDLGLPSGNLWFKCNLDATCETDYGNYYQWGSLKGYRGTRAIINSTFSSSPLNNGKISFNEEYFKKNLCKWVYKNGQLKPKFDIVTQTYGKNYKIPTLKDFRELIENTIITKTIKINGIYGTKLTSKINGNSIFLPKGGFYSNYQRLEQTLYGYYWTSSINLNKLALIFDFVAGESDLKNITIYNLQQSVFNYGYNIRGIKIKDE